jgi:hypothetical protein
MPYEEPRCADCGLTSKEIEQRYPGRVPSVKWDRLTKKMQCNRDWFRTDPSRLAPPRR